MPAPPRDVEIVQLVTSAGDRHQVVQSRQPSRSYGAQFVIVFTAAAAAAADEIRNPTTLRVLLRLPRHLGFSDYRPLRAADLAVRLQVDRSAVTRAMRELHQRGIIERDGRGPYTRWRISCSYGWLGTADQWHAHRSGHDADEPDRDEPAPCARTRLRLLDGGPATGASHGGEPRGRATGASHGGEPRGRATGASHGRPGCAPVARLRPTPRGPRSPG